MENVQPEGQIKKLSSKAKRQVSKRFPMLWILKEKSKILNSAVKFKCWSWKFKWQINIQTMNLAGIVRHIYLEGLIHGGAYFRNFTVYDVEFEIWHGDCVDAASEYQMQNWHLSQM